MLVAPVTDKGAVSRRVYLPRGSWFDFWTEEKREGGRGIERPVDLATMPLFVRAGSIVPMGPIKQYTSEKVDGALALTIYPGADALTTIYDDDGVSFGYRRDDFVKLQASWDERQRRFGLRVAGGSRMLPALSRRIDVRVAPEKASRPVEFSGRPLQVQL